MQYPVSDRYIIICVTEFVISFLIPLENEDKKQCFPFALLRRRSIEHFSYNFYACINPFVFN